MFETIQTSQNSTDFFQMNINLIVNILFFFIHLFLFFFNCFYFFYCCWFSFFSSSLR